MALLTAWSGAAPAHRLSRIATPEHYDIHLSPDFTTDTFGGQVTIREQLAEEARSIALNASEIDFHDATITAGGTRQAATVTLDEQKETATLTVPRPVPDGPAVIAIRYTGRLNDQLRGFYLSRANNREYAITQLEPTDARRAFPSFDEPAMKATFAMTATIDASDTAISNGRLLSDTPGPGVGKHTLKFSTTKRMSAVSRRAGRRRLGVRHTRSRSSISSPCPTSLRERWKTRARSSSASSCWRLRATGARSNGESRRRSTSRMKSRAMALDALRTTRPVRTAVNTPAHINQVFDAIAYQNTAAVGKPVDRVFASFITQSSMPLMTAKMTCASQKTELVLSQRPMSQAVPASTLWDIPVCYKRARDGKLQPAACTLLSGGTQTLRLDGCSSWIFANADRRGYYRTSYDPKNVHALGEAMRNGQLTPLEQTTLLEDLWTSSVFSATSRASPSSSHSRRS